MKPVLILQNLNQDGPAYLGTWLRRHRVPFDVFNTEAGEAFPVHVGDYGALAVLGGEMGANDPLPSLRQAERLIRDAMDADRPVIGHCLGGQLMARALGARVTPSPAPEIGWHPMRLRAGEGAERWFGATDPLLVFQWHYDAFELPAGARWLAESDACAVQAFEIGPHLAMQFHVELDAAKLKAWIGAEDARSKAESGAATVQSVEAMLQAEQRLADQQRIADRVYDRWLSRSFS
jgi:GMP synthase-like glutamine amidotransferase